VQQKRQMVVFELECNMLQTSMTNMNTGDHSRASNQVQSPNFNHGKLNEEATMHQLQEVMEIEQPTLKTWKKTLEEVASRHTFC